MSERVLFVCTANICRSPMAEYIFDDLAAERGLPYTAESAGVRARSGYDMAVHSREALGEIGIDAGDHRSRRVSEEMISGSGLVLVMEPWHAGEIEDEFGPSEKVHVLPVFARVSGERQVSDPHGLTLFAHRASARQIHGHVRGVLDRLREGGFPRSQ